MVTIILACTIPVSMFAAGFFAYKGVQLGLRWQIEVRNEKPPTMDMPKNPIEPIIQSKQEKEQVNILAEWLNGPTESR
ncbi:hypothetical protein [Fictibacillus gelatini]|uniref:hypothetical protein n=1 Tax=Fictibacillus gelatini TaxID=225985 RepID=UPI00047BCDEE|nr:hypothetical protein [Fictibacillus gelatini]